MKTYEAFAQWYELLTGIYELNLIRVDVRFIKIMNMNTTKKADIFYDQIYDLYICVNITISLLKRFIICPIWIYSYIVNNACRFFFVVIFKIKESLIYPWISIKCSVMKNNIYFIQQLLIHLFLVNATLLNTLQLTI